MDRRLTVTVEDDANGLDPQNKTPRKISWLIVNNLDPRKFTWFDVSADMKNEHFMEFQKYFVWHKDDHETVEKRFMHMAGVRYRNRVSNWKKNFEAFGKKTPKIAEEDWPAWIEHWNSPDHKKKCAQAALNRNIEIDGEGSGVSRHFCGSQSYTVVAKKLEVELKRPPTRYDLFMETRTKDGEFMDKKSDDIAKKVKLCLEEHPEEQRTHELKGIIFFDVNPPDKKNCVFGLGSAASTYVSMGSGGCTRSSRSVTQDALQQHKLEMKEHMAEQLEQQKQEMQQQLDRQKQEMLQHMQALAASLGVPLPTPPTPTSG